MICATKRGVRRSTMAGKQKPAAPSLQTIAQRLEKDDAKFGVDGRPHGSRVLVAVFSHRGAATLDFHHPTKKATRGRYAFLRTNAAAAERAMKPEPEKAEA